MAWLLAALVAVPVPSAGAVSSIPAGGTPGGQASAPAAAPGGSPSAAQVYRRLRPSVVRIQCGGGVGAGFVFHTSGHVATALHVVSTGRAIEVRPHGLPPRAARVVAVDADHDLAILALDEPMTDVAPLVLPTPFEPQVGDVAYALGHPFAPQVLMDPRLGGLLDWSLSAGVVSGVTDNLLQVDAPVNPGNSGGPVLDAQGRLLGVVSFEIRQSDGPGFAIAAPRLGDLVAEIDEDLGYRGAWTGNVGFGWGMLMKGEGEIGGLVTTLEGVAWDRLALHVAFSDVATVGVGEGTFPRTEHERRAFEFGVGWRSLLLAGDLTPLYFQVGGGVTYAVDQESTLRRFTRLVEPACPSTGGSCETVDQVLRDTTLTTGWSPTASVGLRAGLLDLRVSVSAWPRDGSPLARLALSLFL